MPWAMPLALPGLVEQAGLVVLGRRHLPGMAVDPLGLACGTSRPLSARTESHTLPDRSSPLPHHTARHCVQIGAGKRQSWSGRACHCTGAGTDDDRSTFFIPFSRRAGRTRTGSRCLLVRRRGRQRRRRRNRWLGLPASRGVREPAAPCIRSRFRQTKPTGGWTSTTTRPGK